METTNYKQKQRLEGLLTELQENGLNNVVKTGFENEYIIIAHQTNYIKDVKEKIKEIADANEIDVKEIQNLIRGFYEISMEIRKN